MTLIPGQLFKSYVKDLIILERSKSRATSLDILARKLWDSAAFDAYIVGQYKKPLLDELDLPVDDASEYAALIEAALKEYKASWGNR